ncbi:N-acetyldiaminopimelate deacetylase [Desulfobulbus elongatus]|uniref:N-acetyldiaminopimelate deacetylase n=1 Tax=Desulfobulbus elongatus TaxID=53332 RepID=UPI000481A663|nr:N-acetyldiaminopimelate deacetylase [Desulfobulbus elongatus]
MLDLIQIRHDLHQIPEVCFHERETSDYLFRIIGGLTKDHLGVEVTRGQTGIVVFLPGTAPEKTIGWRADMDGLAVKEETGLPFASKHEGFMHACGHDVHMTIGLGVLEQLLAQPRKNNFVVLFQPAEEGGGGAKALYDAGAFAQYKVSEFYALHVSPEYPLGTIATKAGTLFASSSTVVVTFNGKAGHAAMPHKTIDAIAAAGAFIMEIQTLVSRNLNPREGSVLTFGRIAGGTQPNSVAASCTLEGTLRVLTATTMEFAHKRIREIAEGVALAAGAQVEVAIESGAYLPVDNNEELTNRFIAYAKAHPAFRFQEAEITMTAEDFGYIVNHIPGMMFWLGVGGADRGVVLHSDTFAPDESVIEPAVRFIGEYLSSLH